MPLAHILIALVVQAALAVPVGNWLAGGLVGTAIFLGREHAQAEYRWIETYGARKRANMPWWGGLDPRVWSLKSVLDWLMPLVACMGVACLV